MMDRKGGGTNEPQGGIHLSTGREKEHGNDDYTNRMARKIETGLERPKIKGWNDTKSVLRPTQSYSF